MNSKLRVAGVGAGFFSRFHYDAWGRLPEVDLVGICDHQLAAAQAAASGEAAGTATAFSDLDEMLDTLKPDLLDIILPPASQMEALAAAVERKVDVICQKPFMPDLARARQAVAMAEKAGIRLIVHENFRFQPWHREVARRLQDGFIGDPLAATFRLRPGDGQGPGAYLDRQPYFQTMPRFLIRETGIHLIDTFRFFFGSVTAVTSRLRRLNPAIAGEDAGIVVLEFRENMQAVFDGNRLADHPARNRRLTMGELLVEGTDGVMLVTGDGNLYHRPFGKITWDEIDYEWQDRGYAGDACHALQHHVVQHVLHGSSVENTGRAYLENLMVEDAAYRSDAEGQRINIAESHDQL